MSEKCGIVSKKYELVAPEGGWGYMIAIAMIIIIVTTTAFTSCFGLIYNDFMKEIGMASTSTAMLTGTIACFYAIFGFFTDSLLRFMSMRQLALVAAVCSNVGVLGTVFANSIFMFFMFQGVFQGIAVGLLFNITCTMLNEYFVKKRLVITGIVQTCIAILTMVMPMFIKWSLKVYGFRGTLLLMSGITLQNIIAVTLLQPVTWHMKKVEVSSEKEMQALMSKDNTSFEKSSSAPVVTLKDIEGNISKSDDKVLDLPLEPEKSKGIKKFIESFLDVQLFKELVVSCVIWGPSLSIFADTIYIFILPQALYSASWDQDQVALALSMFGFGDLAARIVFIIASKWFMKLGTQEIYLIGIVISLVSRLGMLWSKSITVIMICITIIGAGHCFITILIPLVVADVVSPEKFTSAMGIFIMICGLSNLILAPAIGAVRDLTNSYSTAFYILASCFAIIILFWSIELCYKKNKHKREQRIEYLNKIHSNKVKK